MRIISGALKGKKIFQPKDKLTRPLKDLTKESIFNIIKHSNLIKYEIENSNILDLFSGIGSFGFECISHGALNVTFLENYSNAIEILKKNSQNLKCENKIKIISDNIFDSNILDNLKKNNFEIIFLDPPYKERRLGGLLKRIIKLNILKKDGIIIIHRHKNERDDFPDEFNTLKIKTYGISKIIFGN